MRIDPARLYYLRLVEENGQTDEANVRQIGESISSVRTTFRLIDRFQALRLS
jgi:hypothetical protein